MSAGFNPRTQRPFVCTHHNCKGGSGATEGYDGWNHTGPVSNMGGSRATDPEIFELAYPYQLLQYELAPDTGARRGAAAWAPCCAGTSTAPMFNALPWVPACSNRPARLDCSARIRVPSHGCK
jgi:N-methylhydantoinase B/oxoprolinase/acetone carboxylase alpha subunit